ncbi:cathepsin L1 [Strongylocentrotus purpuratus]|uniref:Cathepsin L n=1 Tax=Strongylocentrotus purpuratus TaxID=7668 RepID=A0A7M7N013_STRPU|nr:cathepsin L1 [Strongylocentrotus purpuratus]XP_030829121.1 cathepsin L1 [Strongylocentrotus purpuratus]XP_780653.4 cathepsin L1 [Strongylocentrotus purpuratus]
MKYLSVLLVAACVVSSLSMSFTDFDEDWNEWKNEHGKRYLSDEEEASRRLIWQKNLDIVIKHNLKYDLGHFTYDLGINQFADLQNEEFVAMMTGFRVSGTSKAAKGSTFLPPNNVGELPKTVDWRTKGYVTPVKDQGQCGSCWAFSTTGSVEGQHFKATGKLVSLSEQNLVDCSGRDAGCDGGFMDRAFQYIIDAGGIDTEASYPYKAVDGKCHFKKANVGATVTGYTDVTSGSEKALQKAVAHVGPISVAIDASHMSFQHYKSGVYNEPGCDSTVLDHGVLAVGYGTSSDGTDYWIVKNSWAETWGMNGYVWMSRNKDNQCGIATNASYPLV